MRRHWMVEGSVVTCKVSVSGAPTRSACAKAGAASKRPAINTGTLGVTLSILGFMPRFLGHDDGSSDISSVMCRLTRNNKKQKCDCTGDYHGFRVYGR